jgi:hypothetical protein
MAQVAFNVLDGDISVGCGQILRENNRNPKTLHPNDEIEKALLFGCLELAARTQVRRRYRPLRSAQACFTGTPIFAAI